MPSILCYAKPGLTLKAIAAVPNVFSEGATPPTITPTPSESTLTEQSGSGLLRPYTGTVGFGTWTPDDMQGVWPNNASAAVFDVADGNRLVGLAALRNRTDSGPCWSLNLFDELSPADVDAIRQSYPDVLVEFSNPNGWAVFVNASAAVEQHN